MRTNRIPFCSAISAASPVVFGLPWVKSWSGTAISNGRPSVDMTPSE